MTGTRERKTMPRQDLAVKVGADVIKRAKIVALDKNITLAEYLTETLRPIVDKDYSQTLAKMAREEKAQGKGGTK
jgi:hypothetical protein